VAQYGGDNGRGNLLGIQPYITTWDYASEQTFSAKLSGYLDACRKNGWLTPKTIVVFPEYLGAWLVVAGEKRAVYEAGTIQGAMKTMVLSNLPAFVKHFALTGDNARDKVTYSVFTMKARKMAGIYDRVFSQLAQRYKATIVAGSILPPSPAIKNGRLFTANGPLYNISVVYRPDGAPYPALVRKAYPIETELPFVRPATERPPVFDTPAGRLGVLICADSWFPRPYVALKKGRAEFIVVPSYISPDGVLDQPWLGISGWPTPDDVNPNDVGRLTERSAWLKYALMGRVGRTSARQAMVVTLRGRLWDLGSDGAIDLYRDRAVLEHPNAASALIVNSWF
jgi:predicted amidohydrolase